jgi:hypothetical protein
MSNVKLNAQILRCYYKVTIDEIVLSRADGQEGLNSRQSVSGIRYSTIYITYMLLLNNIHAIIM